MTNDIFAKGLAPALGYDADQVVQYVDKVLELALEELLLNGTVTIAGIGTLKRTYHPSEARESEPGKLYLVPPSQSVELVQTDTTDDFVYETALGQFNMDENRASKFSKGVAITVQKVLDAAREFEFGNIGILKKNGENKVDLIPSGWLTEMLNKSYSHLEPTPISSSKRRDVSAESVGNRKSEEQKAIELPPEQRPLGSREPERKTGTEQAPFFLEENSDKDQGLVAPQTTGLEASKKGEDDLSATFVPAFSPSSAPESKEGKPAENRASTQPSSGSQADRASSQSPSEAKKKSEEDEHAWLYAEPKKDYSPIYITLGVIALVAVLIGMSIVLFSGGDEKQPEKDAAKIERPLEKGKKPASETAAKQNPVTTEETPAVIQEPPADKSEKPVVPPPAKVEQPKAETPQPAPAKTEPAKPSAKEPVKPLPTDKKPQGAAPSAIPAELTRKVDLNKSGYSISIGSFPDKAVAQKFADDYKKKGLTVTLWEVEVKGTVYNRVIVGSFSDQNAAREAIKSAKSVLPQGAFSVKVK
ncbi:MAG: hypothetical protein HGB19_11740 [Chlorobiales bacterium]|nr:hypothetical protein [Chlorobiales bacterium]